MLILLVLFSLFSFLLFDKRIGAAIQLSLRHVHSKKVRKIFLREEGINVAVYIWKEKIMHEKR